MAKKTVLKPVSEMFGMKRLNPILDTFDNLSARWRNENQYEDIEQYRKVLAKALGKDVTNVTMTKRPFAAQFTFKNQRMFIRAERGRTAWGYAPRPR